MKNELSYWLGSKKRDYQAGVKLFTALNVDIRKNQFFNTNTPSSVQINMLERDLMNFARKNDIKPSVKSEDNVSVTVEKKVIKVIKNEDKKTLLTDISKVRVMVECNPTVSIDKLPENLKQKFIECKDLKGQMVTLHAELKAAKDDDTKKTRRSEIAHELVNTRQKYSDNWAEIDEWYIQSEKKTPEELAAEEALKKQRQIEADLNYVRRYFGTTKKKQQDELKIRMERLDNWGINYEKLTGKHTVTKSN